MTQSISQTRTGRFPIGFRRGGGNWQQNVDSLIQWTVENHFAGLDVGALPAEQLRRIKDAGLRIGSVDLPQPWSDLMSADDAKRREDADAKAQYIRSAVAAGAENFFVVMLPEDPSIARRRNLDRAVDGYGRMCEAVKGSGAKIVLEGFPGGGPDYAALACTPESCRAVFEGVGSDVLGVNFDPSHLIRMGIDAVRFCREFADRIYHVHGKDTQIIEEELYQMGNLQPATHTEPPRFGGHHWRYCIPGHGLAPWDKLLAILDGAGYQGMISIELEDANFCDSEEKDKHGLIASRDFLVHA